MLRTSKNEPKEIEVFKLIAIVVKCMPITNHKPLRLKAFACVGESVEVSYEEAYDLAFKTGNACQGNIYYQVAKLWCKKNAFGWETKDMRFGEIEVSTISGYVFCFDQSIANWEREDGQSI